MIKGEKLRIGDTEYPQITMDCIYNPDLGNASWTWTDPSTNETRLDLPGCASKCALEPISRSDISRNWSGLVIFYFIFQNWCTFTEQCVNVY